MSGYLVSQPPSPFQVWPDMEWSQDSADTPGELLRSPTRSCFLLLLLFLGRLSLPALPHLLGTSFSSLWSPPFLPHAPALIPSSLTKVRLSFTLTLSHLTIWYFGQTALFFFFLAKTVLANLPTTRSVALGLPFPFQQPQYAQVFPLKPASLCKLSAGLSSTNKSATSFLLSFSLTLALLSPPCPLLRLSFYLNLTRRSGRNSFLFLFVLSGYKWVLGHTFFPGNDAADELVRWGAYSRPLQSLVVSLFLSIKATLLFSRTGGVLSHLNSLTPRFPLFPPRNLCSLVMLAVFSLVFAATDTAYY